MIIVLYQTAGGRTSIDVKLENETVWLSKEQMAILFYKGELSSYIVDVSLGHRDGACRRESTDR